MKNNLLLGSGLTLLAALFYALQTALIKFGADFLPPLPVVIFIQSLVSLILICPFIFKKGFVTAKKTLATKNVKLHVLRTIFSLSISYLLFYAVTFIPLVNGILLANTTPLFVPFIGYFFLGLTINHKLWLPIIMGYTGVILVLNPDAHIFSPYALLALTAGLATASSMLIVRRLSVTEATETTAFYFFTFSALISGLIAIPFWHALSFPVFFSMISIGVLYFLTQYSLTAGLRHANAQLVGALFYANVIYAVIISMLVWHNMPSLLTLLGMAFIITGGIFCIHVERGKMQKQLIKPVLKGASW